MKMNLIFFFFFFANEKHGNKSFLIKKKKKKKEKARWNGRTESRPPSGPTEKGNRMSEDS